MGDRRREDREVEHTLFRRDEFSVLVGPISAREREEEKEGGGELGWLGSGLLGEKSKHLKVPPISSSASKRIGSNPFSVRVLRAVRPAGPPEGERGNKRKERKVELAKVGGRRERSGRGKLTSDDGNVRHLLQIR